MYPVLRGDEWIGGREGCPISMLMPSPLEPCPTQNTPPLFVLGKHLATSEEHAGIQLVSFFGLSSIYCLVSSWHTRVTLLLHITGPAFEVLNFLGQSGQWLQKCEWEVADWLHLPPNCSSLPHYFLPFLPLFPPITAPFTCLPSIHPQLNTSFFYPLYLNCDLFSCST